MIFDIIHKKIKDNENEILTKKELSHIKTFPAHKQYILLNSACSKVKMELAKILWNNMHTPEEFKQNIIITTICEYPQKNSEFLEWINKESFLMINKLPHNFINFMEVQESESVWTFVFSFIPINENV